jgi:hypothetical protein
MTSKSSVVALVASAASWSCSPVANPIIEGTGGLHADAAGGAPDTGGAGMDGSFADAATDLPPPSQICGNGEREGDEYCDDAKNPTKGFGCKDDCTGLSTAVCNDGVVTSPEVCDGPAVYCENCTKIVGSCGDGITQSPVEVCDSKGESATCNANCTSVRCGDQIVNRAAKEVCDDGLNDGQPGSCAVDCSDYASKAIDAQAASCKELLAAKRAAGQTFRTGFYWLKGKDATAYVAYCDAVSEGGGWTLVMRAIDSNFDYDDPLWSNATLENEIIFDFSTPKTRSKYRPYVEVSFTEIRTSEPTVDLSVGYVAAAVGSQASAQAFFGANGGEGVGITIAMGPDSLEDYFDARAVFDDRQWGCDQFIFVGLNTHALTHVQDLDSKSLGTGTDGHCDWDGGARFGQRVNTCHYSSSGRECSGNHGGQGWGNFNNITVPLKARIIKQLLWVR